MSTSNTDSFIASTKEYQVLQKYFNILTRAITDPVRLAAELFTANLISESTRIKANNVTSSCEIRNHYLLDELMIAVAIDSTNITKIITVLQGQPLFLTNIADKMKTEYESSVTTTTQSSDQQHLKTIVTVGESAYNDLTIMQIKLGGLVLTIQKEVKSAGIEFDDLKQLLILSYPFEKEIQEAENFARVFVAVLKLCSPVNIEVLLYITDHFKLTDALVAIQATSASVEKHEVEKQNYHEKLLSTTFAQKLQKEAEIIGRNPLSEHTIALKLKWSSTDHFTVKEFEKIVKNLFLDYSQYIHLCEVVEGCIIVTMCAPKPLMGALVKMAKTRLPYILDIGVILLQIGDEIIIDKREKEPVVYVGGQGLEKTQTRPSQKEEDAPSIIEHIAPQQQSQLSKLEKDITDQQSRDEEVRALEEENEKLRQQLQIQKGMSQKKTIEMASIEGSNITDTPGSISLPHSVPEDESVENNTEREIIHTEVYQDQPLPVDNSSIISTISQTAPQQQTQLSNVSKLKKDVNSDGTGDLGNDSATGLYTPTWRQLPRATYDILIIGSFEVFSDSQTIQVTHKHVPSDQEGSNQWMIKEIDLIRKLHEKNPHCHVLVCSNHPGAEHSKDYYLEKITNFLANSKQDGAGIWYTGNGEKSTGNWCFKDGVITFQDIFGLYMDCFRGKRLNIYSDCNYSGNWIKDCVKTLDDLGIPSCGHYTREQGILFKIFCSCSANEEFTALCYITEANIFDEIYKGVLTYYNKKLSSGQTTQWGDFRSIRCSKTATETCEIDSTCTWEDRIFTELYQVRLVRGKKEGKPAWCYVQVNKDKVEDFKAKIRSGTTDLPDYFMILESGWGQDPPKDAVHQIELKYFSYIDPEC